MKIYDGGRAPNPRRVQIFLKEKGLELPTQQLDLNSLEHKTQKMTEKNPLQTVPFLELDDGTVIAETVAICRYLEELHPDPCLFGADPLERAMVEMWNRRVELGFFFKVAQSFRHLHPGAAVLEGEQIEAWGKKNQDLAMGFLPVLDQHFSTNRFFVGERFSVADITCIVAVQFFKPARLQIPEEGLINFRRWLEEVLSRPSVQL
ncbi:MAG: glutathione S-transferase family protein [Pseudomonadota bacterium]